MLSLWWIQPLLHQVHACSGTFSSGPTRTGRQKELWQPQSGSSPAVGITGTLQPMPVPTDLLTASAPWEQSWASFAVLRGLSASVSLHIESQSGWG